MILYFLILDGSCQISQGMRSNNRRILTRSRSFQDIIPKNIQFIQSPDPVPQLRNVKKEPVKITSDQASKMLGLSFLRGRVLPPGTIIQRRGQSIKVVLPKLEVPNTSAKLPVQPKLMPNMVPRNNRKNGPISIQQVQGTSPINERGSLQPIFRGESVNVPQIPRPKNLKLVNANNFQPVKKTQEIPDIPSPRRQLLPVSPPRKAISIPPLTVNPVSNIDNNFIHTNGIQPPAPINKIPEGRHMVGPPSEVPPNDFVVSELNNSNNFLETARRLALARRLRTVL
uniref:Uncharacterized protein n=1 Tax=Strongyloides papillosus TaxID=174720 RepID=A0A0N5CG40_STREA